MAQLCNKHFLGKAVVSAIFLGLFIGLLLTIRTETTSTTATETNAQSLLWDKRLDAPLTNVEIAGPLSVCQDFVKDRLQAPSTANFPWNSDDYQIDWLIAPENAYNVEGYFDAQNAFGVMLHGQFTCKVKQAEDNTWRMINLEIR